MLEVRDLSIRVGSHEIVAIEQLDVPRGRRLGLVGESGSGKTLTAMSFVGLQPSGIHVSGSIKFMGRELVGLGSVDLADIRGQAIGVVFQDPHRALNPVMRVGRQVAEAIRLHNQISRAEVRLRSLELLRRVHLPNPADLVKRYPHQLSGGQQQRVLIAIAIACRPRLLIADEPTTALDVTVQEGILKLLLELSDQEDMALMLVSHDLGVVRAVSQHIAVMYGGRIVESGPADAVILHPRHRYTEALVATNPGYARTADIPALSRVPLKTIAGSVPALGSFPSGCRFRDRCEYEIEQCKVEPADTGSTSPEHQFKCWNPTDPVEAPEVPDVAH